MGKANFGKNGNILMNLGLNIYLRVRLVKSCEKLCLGRNVVRM